MSGCGQRGCGSKSRLKYLSSLCAVGTTTEKQELVSQMLQEVLEGEDDPNKLAMDQSR